MMEILQFCSQTKEITAHISSAREENGKARERRLRNHDGLMGGPELLRNYELD